MSKHSLARQSPSDLASPERTVGRPTLYRPELCDQIIAAMGEGLSADAAAAKIGISVRSLYIWQQEHPAFMHAIQEGRIRALLWWEERALAMAQGKPGSAQIVSLGLRNRSRAASGWVDTNRVEMSGPNGGPVQQQILDALDLRSLTDNELELLSQLLRVAGERGVTTLKGDINVACVSDISSNPLRIA